MMIINPGTGVVRDVKASLARSNMTAFVKELGGRVRVAETGHEEEGRWRFTLSSGRKRCTVDMPGCPRAGLTNPALVGLVFPYRLYVDGMSWIWGIALGRVRDVLGIKDPDDGPRARASAPRRTTTVRSAVVKAEEATRDAMLGRVLERTENGKVTRVLEQIREVLSKHGEACAEGGVVGVINGIERAMWRARNEGLEDAAKQCDDVRAKARGADDIRVALVVGQLARDIRSRKEKEL